MAPKIKLDPEAVRQRVEAARPQIEQMMALAGAPGLSFGVVISGQPVVAGGVGLRDVERQLPADEETMYPFASTLKVLLSSLVGILVDEGRLGFDDRVADLLPAFRPAAVSLRDSRLSDWLSMRTENVDGMDAMFLPWMFPDGTATPMPAADRIEIINSLPASKTRRAGDFSYSNFNYELVSHVIDACSGGEPWDDLLERRILNPLGLDRTDVHAGVAQGRFDNVAVPYGMPENGPALRLPNLYNGSRKTFNGASMSGSSCVRDLLVLWAEIMRCANDQFANGTTSTPGGAVFKNLRTTMSAQTPEGEGSFREKSFGMGWSRTQLPAKETPAVLPEREGDSESVNGPPPFLVGEGAPPQLLISRFGLCMGGNTESLLFPDAECAIVVLTSTYQSLGLASYIAQALAQVVFDWPIKYDIAGTLARTVAAERREVAKKMRVLDEMRKAGPVGSTRPRSLHDYVGAYRCEENKAGWPHVQVSLDSGGRGLTIWGAGAKGPGIPLEHFERNIFCWLRPHTEHVRRAYLVGFQSAEYYLVSFEEDPSGNIDRLILSLHEDSAEGPVVLVRQP